MMIIAVNLKGRRDFLYYCKKKEPSSLQLTSIYTQVVTNDVTTAKVLNKLK